MSQEPQHSTECGTKYRGCAPNCAFASHHAAKDEAEEDEAEGEVEMHPRVEQFMDAIDKGADGSLNAEALRGYQETIVAGFVIGELARIADVMERFEARELEMQERIKKRQEERLSRGRVVRDGTP